MTRLLINEMTIAGWCKPILATSQGKVGVILNAPGQVEVFNYYAQNRLLTFGIPAHLV
jgi:hypothetical protein